MTPQTETVDQSQGRKDLGQGHQDLGQGHQDLGHHNKTGKATETMNFRMTCLHGKKFVTIFIVYYKSVEYIVYVINYLL